jgi:hypothetical protein
LFAPAGSGIAAVVYHDKGGLQAIVFIQQRVFQLQFRRGIPDGQVDDHRDPAFYRQIE